MRKLHFIYEMEIEYSVPVAKCYFTIKCVPKNTRRQKIENISIKIFPDTIYNVGKDGFKNIQLYGVNDKPHNLFRFEIEGDAYTGLNCFEAKTDENLDMIFNHPYGLNKAGEKIKQYFEEHRPDESKDKYEQAIEIMHCLHKDFNYEPCTTDVDTTAEEAFSQGKGVCQDYAHIFIALLHLLKIPARYVTGLIVGEGASHAWVEILIDGKWYGLDPTNDKIVNEDHIKIGVGRDAKDCMINRGIMHGGGIHIQKVWVNVN